MPTINQITFITDCEAAVAAVKSQGREVKRIGEILEAAGRHLPELNVISARLAAKGNFAELKRLQKAFQSVGLNPRCVEKAISAETLSVSQIGSANKAVDLIEEANSNALILKRAMPELPSQFFAGFDCQTPEPVEAIKSIEVANIFKEFERPNKRQLSPSEALASVIDMLTPMSSILKQRVLQSAGLFLGVGE